MSDHHLSYPTHHHHQPVFYGTASSEDEPVEPPMPQTSSSYAPSSSGDESMDGSEVERSSDLSDAAMGVGSVADSEISSRQTVSTLHPHDSISQRGDQKQHLPVPSIEGSVADMHSFNSDDDITLFKKLHGRAFASQSDGYMLPADDREHSRLDLQHNIVKFHLRRLYPYPRWVEWLLRSGQAQPPAVLDIGTGSGRWAVDMALQFPHAEVLGIDLVPPVLLNVDTIPHNCRFEVDDANLSMAHHKNCFDVVHARSIDQGIHNYNGFIYEVAQTIRPHGILMLCLGSPQFYTEDRVPLPVTEPGQEGFTWLQALLYRAYKALHHRGNYGIDAPLYWERWLLANPNYENVQVFDYYIPIGAWKQGLDENDTWVADAMKINIMHVFEAFRPLLLTDGFSTEDIDTMVKGATEELRDQTIHVMSRWMYVTAIRRDVPWHERLEEVEPLNYALETLIVAPSPPGTKSSAARSVGFSPLARQGRGPTDSQERSLSQQ
ncbi:hypothetical protein FRB97_004667 [Tulasnella sp. 331]|nr:hypothetical protein FRB97_004667 [Tulasnella sp. 331]